MGRTFRMMFTVAVGLCLAAAPAFADIRLPALLGDNMVLQRGTDIHLWGWADPGERVVVAFADQKAETAADENGQWAIRLQPMKAGGPFGLVLRGKNTTTLADVLVGDVWICSGQSNMDWPVRWSADADREIAAADYPRIRLFTVEDRAADEPQVDTQGQWEACSPQTVADFSAVAYYYGRELFQNLDVPIGLVLSSWGGTRIDAWIKHSTLQTEPRLQGIFGFYLYDMEQYELCQQEAWEQAAAKARAEGLPPPVYELPPTPNRSSGRPSGPYNGMIAPLSPYRIRGVIWYQGEANVERPEGYDAFLSALISDWRDDWGQGDFPFLFVQLAKYLPGGVEPPDSYWARVRDSQRRVLALPNTAMVVTIDLGQADDIHPKNKQEVGRRLALAARAVAYGEAIEYSGPIVRSAALEGGKVRLSFDHVGGGLVARGDKLTGFSIAGANKTFVWAEARIDGDSILVWSDTVPSPYAVRYAWADNPDASLYNRNGLPASPFHVEVRAAGLFDDPVWVVWLYAVWMIVAVAVGTVAGYQGLVRATQLSDGRRRLPGRFLMQSHIRFGTVYYVMIYSGVLLGGIIYKSFPHGHAVMTPTVGRVHLGLVIAIAFFYGLAWWVGRGLVRRPAGSARVRPRAHMILNFVACALVGAQILLAVYTAWIWPVLQWKGPGPIAMQTPSTSETNPGD